MQVQCFRKVLLNIYDIKPTRNFLKIGSSTSFFMLSDVFYQIKQSDPPFLSATNLSHLSLRYSVDQTYVAPHKCLKKDKTKDSNSLNSQDLFKNNLLQKGSIFDTLCRNKTLVNQESKQTPATIDFNFFSAIFKKKKLWGSTYYLSSSLYFL